MGKSKELATLTDATTLDIAGDLSVGGLTVGADQLAVDASGRVTMPYQPSFNIYQSAPFTAASGVWTQNVNLDTVRHNVGNHFNTSNGSFTAPVSGSYLFSYTTHFNSTTANYFYTGLQVNGSFQTYLFGYNSAVSGADNTFGGSVIIHLNANDVVTFWNYDGDGGTIGHGFQRTNASGHLIG